MKIYTGWSKIGVLFWSHFLKNKCKAKSLGEKLATPKLKIIVSLIFRYNQYGGRDVIFPIFHIKLDISHKYKNFFNMKTGLYSQRILLSDHLFIFFRMSKICLPLRGQNWSKFKNQFSRKRL